MKPIDAILLLGPTGAGKTPLGNYIGQQGIAGRRCLHFDFGHELRTIAGPDQSPPAFNRREHRFVRDVLEKGLLLEDKHFPLAEKIIQNFLDRCGYQGSDLLILNGLPRHVGQARDMKALVNVTHLLVLECTAEDVCKRIEENTGGDRHDRADDTEVMIRKKIGIFRNRTVPLMQYYADLGSSLITVPVDASSTSESLFTRFASHFTLYSHSETTPLISCQDNTI